MRGAMHAGSQSKRELLGAGAMRTCRNYPPMATKEQVQEAIFKCEGFRVALEPFDEKRRALPPYEYLAMAPQRWKVSDWKNARLEAYRLLVKGATIYRGDGSAIPRDLQLGKLRDTYYEANYGSLDPLGEPPAQQGARQKVTSLTAHRKRSK
jgi:hypothetical protein